MTAHGASFRPFFVLGIVTVLTTGCLLGAVALAGIARVGGYTASTWTPYVLAHANAQVFGWVGAFVVGFALHQHPPASARRTLFRRLAWGTLALLTAAIPLRFAAEASRSLPLGLAASGMQALAVLLFGANSSLTRKRIFDPRTGARAPLPWQSRFVFASLFWWLAVSLAEPWIFVGSHAPAHAESVAFVARWFPLLREAQFLGFVPMMVFGVALSRLTADFGRPPARRAPAEVGFLLWNGALVARLTAWRTDDPVLLHAGALGLAAAAGLLVFASGFLEPADGRARALRFVQAALFWLLAAGALLALEPLHLARICTPFSHAYTGAIRHALTVGFISQMIVGVSLHLVPHFVPHGVDPRRAQAPLHAVFWLLNGGNAARVALEIATDTQRWAFAPMGATGFVEWTALALWAAHLAPWLLRGRP